MCLAWLILFITATSNASAEPNLPKKFRPRQQHHIYDAEEKGGNNNIAKPLMEEEEKRRVELGDRVYPTTVFQACRKEIPKFCRGPNVGIDDCLKKNIDLLEEGTPCRDWLVARKTCFTAAKELCPNTGGHSPRKCIRSLDESQLPSECTNSAFYKSLMRATWRKTKKKRTGPDMSN